MDPFALIMIGLIVGFLLFVLALGQWYPGSGADVLDWKPTRSPEVEIQNEIDDVSQMIDAQNAIRRRRGLPDRDVDDVEASVERDKAELRALADRYFDEHGGGAPERTRGIDADADA